MFKGIKHRLIELSHSTLPENASWLRNETRGQIGSESEDHLNQISRRFHNISKRLDQQDLRASPNDELTADDLFGDLILKDGGEHFLGFYGEKGMWTALDRYGIWRQLGERGLSGFTVRFNLRDPRLHRMCIYCDNMVDPSRLISELRVRLVHRPSESDFSKELGDDPSDFLYIDWLLLQNPKAAFDPKRPPLPGQNYPGLGIGHEVLELLRIMIKRLRLAGLINVPMHYHNAYLYHIRSRYLLPEVEGRLMALVRDTATQSLGRVSWAMALGCIVDCVEDRPVDWSPHEQIYPINPRLKPFFESDDYKLRCERTLNASRFAIDETKLAEKLAEVDE